jgi:hypothetical protein
MPTYADVCAEREESRTQGEIKMPRMLTYADVC